MDVKKFYFKFGEININVKHAFVFCSLHAAEKDYA